MMVNRLEVAKVETSRVRAASTAAWKKMPSTAAWKFQSSP